MPKQDLFQKYLDENKQSLLNQHAELSGDLAFENKVSYSDSNANTVNYDNTAENSYIPSVADIGRLLSKQVAQIRLSSSQEDLREKEATWLPQIQEASDYINAVYSYRQLSELNTDDYSKEQIDYIENEKYNLLNQINSLEPSVRENARTNPYLQDIFYETSLANAVGNEDINSTQLLLKAGLVDWNNSRLTNINPTDNLSQLIEYGASDSFDRLSQDDINVLWNMKTDINDKNKVYGQLQQVTKALEDVQTVYDSKLEDVIKKTNTVNKGNWLFDPSKIDPRSIEAFENNEISLTDPISWYKSIPHVGSSYAEFETIGAQMLANTALNALAGTALTVSTGGIAPLLWGATELGLQYSIAQWGRQKETASEAFDNYQQRVTEEIQKRNIDWNSVEDNVKAQLKQLGFDTDSMTEQQLFGAMISSGIDTGDAAIDEVIDDSRKGLDVLIKGNDALQLSDLIEAGMYMYGGRYLKKLTNLTASGSKTTGNLAEVVNANVENTLSAANPSLLQNAKTILSNKLAKVATFGTDNQIKLNSAKRIIEGLGDYSKKALITSFMESQEEGIQYMLGKEYSEGKYDAVNPDNYSLIDGLANDLKLGFQARAAYYGLSTDDDLNTDKELRQNMDVGSFVSLFIGGAYKGADIYKGIRQLTTDRKLQELAANGYDNAEKDQKIDAFIKAVGKGRNSLNRIHNTLDWLKNSKVEGITNDMIEQDKELASSVFGIVNSKITSTNTKDLGINKDSNSYNRYVHNAVQWLDRARTANNDASQASDNLNKLFNEIINYQEGKNKILDAVIENIKNDYIREAKLKAFNDYKEGKTEDVIEPDPISTKQILSEALRYIELQTQQQLINELSNRKLDLKKIAEARNIKINTEDISGMLEYVKNIFDANSKNKVYSGVKDIVDALSNRDDYSNAVAAYLLNQGVADQITKHGLAYVTGKYAGDVSLIKPTWNNLTEDQRQDILNSYAEEDKRAGRQLTKKEDVIKDYDNKINEQWKKDDEKADQEAVMHKRALSLIQRDLRRRTQLEQTAQEENESNNLEEPQQEQQTEQKLENETVQESNETPQTEEKPSVSEVQATPVLPPTDLSELQREQSAIDALRQQLSGESTTEEQTEQMVSDSDIETPEETIPQEQTIQKQENKDIIQPDGVEQINDDINDAVEATTPEQDSIEDINKDIELTTNNVVETTPISDEDLQNPPVLISEEAESENSVLSTAEKVEKGEHIDLTPVQESSSMAVDEMPKEVNDVDDAVPAVEIESEQNQVETNKVIEPEEQSTPIITEKKSTEIINTDSPNNATPENIDFFIADASQVVTIDDTIGISPTSNVDDFVSIDPAMLAVHSVFEDVYNQSTGSIESTDIQSQDQYIERTKGLSNDKKQKRNLMRNTFFFQPNATEPLILKANGEEVKFVDKNGNIAKRGTGKQLAELLAIPGWFSSIDDCYYIVTDAWKDDRRVSNSKTIDSAVNNAAIHLILEKDGVVYTVSIRTPQRAEYELRELGINKDNISKEIEALCLFRRQVIDAYAPNYTKGQKLPTIADKSCKPTNVRISNGSINNVRNEQDEHEFRKLTEVDDINLSDDPYEITEAIEEGDLEIGYGKGAFCLNDPFSIVKLSNTEELTSAQGIGYAGKLYLIPKVEQTPSQRMTAPIMLTEEKHWIQGIEKPEDLKLVYDKNHQIANADNKLTTAEIIYELLTSNYFGDDELNAFFLTLLANNGDRTVPHFKSQTSLLQHYVRKALNIKVDEKGRTILQIGTPGIDTVTLAKNYKISNINVGSISDTMRRRVIFNISRNIHWNTDKDLLMSRIPESVVKYIVDIAKSEYLGKEGFDQNTEMYILGDAVTFSLKDIGYTVENGEIKKIKDGPAPSVISWMINHGKIKIDTGNHLFKAPFVFASGVNKQVQTVATVEAQTGVTENKKAISETPVTKKQNVEKKQEVSNAPKKYYTHEIIENGVKKQVVEELNPEWEKNIGKKPMLITDELLQQYGLEKPTKQPIPGFKYVIQFHKTTGKPMVIPLNSKEFIRLFGHDRYKKGGWFSTQKGSGKMNISKSRKWLNEKLGLAEDDVLLTNSILRTHSDQKAYGVMRVVWDVFKKEFNPQIVLSYYAGKDVTYHEAWHYVSQLLLTDNQRSVLYQEYVKRHPKAKDYTKTEVEEALAEEFREYMAGLKKYILSYPVLRLFDRLSRLIGLDFLRPSLHNQMFARINSGEFAKYKPSQDILREFHTEYDNGLHLYIPGMSKEDYDKIPNIYDGDTFYNIVRSLTGSALSYMKVRTQRDLQKGLNINQLFDSIEELYNNDMISEENKSLALDVLSNRPLFTKYIKNYLSDLGIDKELSDKKIAEQDDDAMQKRETGDNPDNVWDVEQGAHSKKDKLSFNAKLFFYSIPQYEFETIEDEDGKISRIATPVLDPLFGLNTPVPFSLAWNKVLENLWNIDSYEEIVETTDRLSKTDPFFFGLKEVLSDPERPLTEWEKRQLEVAIKSSKNSMTTIKIKNDTPHYSQEDDAIMRQQKKEEAEKRSIWEVKDSSNLTKIARYPKQWSLSFFSSDNTILTDDGKRTVNPLLVKQIKQSEKEIEDKLKLINKPEVDQVKLYDDIRTTFVDLMNTLYIPLDIVSFDYMISKLKSVDKDNKYLSELQRFKNLWKSNKGYSIQSILANIKNYQDAPRKATKRIDRIFTVPPSNTDSFISLVAVAYGNMHPSPEEFSVTGADGSLRYPISENNYMSDQIRWLNKGLHNKKENILNTNYGKSSLIANNAGKIEFKLHTLIAVDEQKSQTSRDYFGISPIEDYITKLCLTNSDHMVLPTMSDKKTWYSISGLDLLHETLSRLHESRQRVNGVVQNVVTLGERVFSDRAIEIFSNYFLSELDTVIDYYNKKDYVAANPEYWRKNYHGKIKKGKMQPGGNGGKFRYFNIVWFDGKEIHLNNDLSKLEKNEGDTAVKIYLNNLKEQLQKGDNLKQLVNNYLIDCTNREVEKLIEMGIITRDSMGILHNKLIPHNIVAQYTQQFSKKVAKDYSSLDKLNDVIYSIIGSHVANQAISIQEVEKCFTGDPAFYKQQTISIIYKPNDDSFKPVIHKKGINDYLEKNPDLNPKEYAEFNVVVGRDVDKIKRLSSVLSTGSDMCLSGVNTEYTVLNLADNQVSTPFYQQLLDFNKLSLIRDEYELQHPENKIDEIYQIVTKDTMDDILKQFDKATQNKINKLAELAAKPYKYDETKGEGINQSDAAVYMRPDMWRRLMIAQGQWNDAKEKAYRIVENNDNWMNDPITYRMAKELILNVQKMVYMGDTYDSSLNLDIPVFNKMAIFPMFKSLCKADNKLIYDRMNNEELGVIDMIVFESAVKVGLGNTVEMYKDAANTELNVDMLNKPSFTKTKKTGDLPTLVQDIKHLRLQLNTDPHEHMDRSMGTQAVKMFLSNLRDDLTYGANKGKNIKGSEIKNTIMQCINRLTEMGVDDMHKKFFKWDKASNKWVLSNQKLSEELMNEARSSGLSDEVIAGFELDENGDFKQPISALSSRNWIESRIISLVNKTVIDINTKGGAAIQMSNFGFKKTRPIEYSEDDMKPLNNGNALKFLRPDGSMEIMLSTNFFRHIVPKEKQATFGMMRKWLLDNNIIGENSKPIGLGYRIPTQGSSSTFAFTVMDVLPETYADTVVVPDGFTAMTGSDFDIDKLYIAMYDFIDGKKVEYDETKDFYKQSREAITNRMLEYQIMCISDENNMAETKASIDTLTSFLKDDVLPLVKPSVYTEAKPGYELLPSFQLSRKIEYTSGKAGIAPFALNSTNHALTQFAHLCMEYSNDNKYNLGRLDAIKGQDGFRILDWLSAMINAHVDVAKDPYIISLNVNQITYNMTNLLLRGGKGQTTFYFLAQDILKNYAAEQIANRGVYGVDPTITEQKVISKYYNTYEKQLRDSITKMPEGEEKQKLIKLYNGWLRDRGYTKNQPIGELNDDNATLVVYDWALDKEKLITSLKASKNSPEYLYQQLLVLKAYKELDKDAKRLAKLVKISQIDTKKYGNNLSLQMNFKNMVESFKNENGKQFYINDPNAELRENQNAIDYYLQKTFLGKKLYYGLTLPRTILRKQSVVATKEYEDIFINVMRTFTDSEENESQTYEYTNDQDFIIQINRALEAIVRARIAGNNSNFNIDGDKLYNYFVGENTMCRNLTAVKRYIVENKEQYPTLVDQNTGNIKNALLNYLQEYSADGTDTFIDKIVLSNSSMNNDKYTENMLISAFDDLLNHEDPFIREFADELATYAYFTSYDNSSVNSFFNLVPLSWKQKKGYVSIIKKALNKFGDINTEAGTMVAEPQDDPTVGLYPSIAITLVRNMWFNRSIVKPYQFNSDSGDTDIYLSNDPQDRRVAFMSKQAKDRFINVNGKLYRKAGDILISRKSDGTNIRSSLRTVYVLTPKLGVQDGNTKIFEYVNASNQLSAFPNNNIANSAIISGNELAEIISSQKDQLIDKILKISSKNRVSKEKTSTEDYTLNYANIDNTVIDAKDVQENNDVYVDPNYTEYSSMDTSFVSEYVEFTDTPGANEIIMSENSADQLMTETIVDTVPEALQMVVNNVVDTESLIASTINEIQSIPNDNVVEASELNDMASLGIEIKKACKGK